MKKKLRLYAWLFGLGILPLLAQAAIYNTGGIPTKDTGSNNRVFVSEFNTMVKVLENLYYNDGSKRIGIGTSSPATSLSIVAPRPILSLGTNDGSNKGIRFEYNEAAQELRIQAGTADGAFDGANLMVIERDTFKVGIGDADPDGDLRLDVEGKIGATEYCDQNGNDCFSAAEIGAEADTGITTLECVTASLHRGENVLRVFDSNLGVSHPVDEVVQNDTNLSFSSPWGTTYDASYPKLTCKMQNGWATTGCGVIANGTDNDEALIDGNTCLGEEDYSDSTLTARCCQVVEVNSYPTPTTSPVPVVFTYEWRASGWGACKPGKCFNSNFSSGTMSRTVDCYNAQTNRKTADRFCSGSKPRTKQRCTPYTPWCDSDGSGA